MSGKKRCNTNRRNDNVRFSGNDYGSEFEDKDSSSLNQGEDEGVADGISGNLSRLTKDGFPQLCEQGDNICQIKCLIVYVFLEHTSLYHLI